MDLKLKTKEQRLSKKETTGAECLCGDATSCHVATGVEHCCSLIVIIVIYFLHVQFFSPPFSCFVQSFCLQPQKPFHQFRIIVYVLQVGSIGTICDSESKEGGHVDEG